LQFVEISEISENSIKFNLKIEIKKEKVIWNLTCTCINKNINRNKNILNV